MSLKIIHFSSPGCSICTTQDKILADVAKNHAIETRSVLITTGFAEALQYGVKSAPTLVYLINDKALAVMPGLQNREKIESMIEQINSD